MCLKRVTNTARARTVVLTLVLGALITAKICILTIPAYWGSPLESVFGFLALMFFIRNLRETWKRIGIVLFYSFPILLLFTAYLLLFTLFGFTLFLNDKKYYDDYGYWITLQDAAFNVYVLFTTSNFPDIIFPYYKRNNVTVFYFIGFLACGIYLVMNLVVAVFYNEYKNTIERKLKKYDSTRVSYIQVEFFKILNLTE